MASCCSVGDEGRWGLRYILLAVVPRVAIDLMEATVSGEWVVETWHAAMETALLCTSVYHSITPVIRRDDIRKTGEARGERLGLIELTTLDRQKNRTSWILLLYLSSRVRRRLPW